jgi:1,3-beta-glucanosyltransferase GAS1
MFSAQMTTWSGGIAFSYFPAQSAQGQFGMVTISADGSSITTSSDFELLQQQYSEVTFLNSPLESADGTPTYPSCPADNSVFLASPTLPPTPNNTACSCVENNLSCQFTPATNNFTAIVGVLLNTACSLLGEKGGTCNDISSNGTTGVYGLMSSCDPSTSFLCIIDLYSQYLSRHRIVICHEPILRDYR